jgi:hypothetical protein
MFLRAIPVVALVTSLSACGGSSDGSAVNPVPTPTPSNAQVLKTFANGDGVARTAVSNDGFADIANVVVGDVQNTVALINQTGLTITTETSTVVSTDVLGSYYQGTSRINGELVNVTEFYDVSGDSWIIAADNARTSALFAGGTQVSNIPAGSYTYTGANVIGNRDGSAAETGTFEMLVNFPNSTASILGATATTAISGNMSVNNQTGTFSGDNMLLSTGFGPASATILGNFHGNGATAVSGVYYDNLPNPVVAGAIAGSR